MTESTVEVAVQGAVAQVRLNRPKRLNALSVGVVAELRAAVRELDADRSVRVVLLSGAGRNFCAGADLAESAATLRAIEDGTFSPAQARREAELGRELLDAVEAMRAVTVALVQGAAVGAGVSLAAACDLRVLTTDASLTLPELDLGIPLAWGATARLVRDIGASITRQLLLTGAKLPAAAALAHGFAYAVVEPAALAAHGSDLAQSLAAKPPQAMTIMKRRVTLIAQSNDDATSEAAAMVAALADPETLAAIRARLTAVLGPDLRATLAN